MLQTALSQLQGSCRLRWEREQLRGHCISPQSTILGGCEGCPWGWVPGVGDARWQRGELPVPMARGPRGAPARQMWGLNPSGAFCRGNRRRWPRGGVHNSRQPKASCCRLFPGFVAGDGAGVRPLLLHGPLLLHSPHRVP